MSRRSRLVHATEDDMARFTRIVEGREPASASQRKIAALTMELNERTLQLSVLVAITLDIRRGCVGLNQRTVSAFIHSGGQIRIGTTPGGDVVMQTQWPDPIERLRFYGALGVPMSEIDPDPTAVQGAPQAPPAEEPIPVLPTDPEKPEPEPGNIGTPGGQNGETN